MKQQPQLNDHNRQEYILTHTEETYYFVFQAKEHENKRRDMETESLIETITQCVYNVRTHLATGFLESVYQKALMIELKEKGIHADTEMLIDVYYRDEIVGGFRADIIAKGEIVIESKAV